METWNGSDDSTDTLDGDMFGLGDEDAHVSWDD